MQTLYKNSQQGGPCIIHVTNTGWSTYTSGQAKRGQTIKMGQLGSTEVIKTTVIYTWARLMVGVRLFAQIAQSGCAASCTGDQVWFGLCCLMTTGLSKDIRGHI